MATLDLSDPISRCRLGVADFQDLQILPDGIYEYLLDKHANNETAVIREAAQIILGTLSHNTRERVDRLEVFGNQAFEQYLTFIKEVIKSPNGAYGTLGGIYAGGMDIADILANKADTTVVQRRLPVGEDGEYSYLPYDSEYAKIQSGEL